MCEPTTIMMGAGLVMGAYMQHKQGQVQKATGKANARMLEMKSEDARARGKTAEDKIRRDGAALKGKQMAQLGASGVEVTTGSAAELLSDTDMMTELDALTLRNNTERAIWTNDFAATSALANGSNQASQANMGAFGSLLSGAGKVDAQWTKYKSSQTTAPAATNLVPAT